MTFDTDKITYQDAVKLGEDTAKVKVVEYTNLACPDALAYQETFSSFLDPLVKTGQVQRILKHYDKDRPRLQKGAVMNRYVPYADSVAAYNLMDDYLRNQGNWANLSLEEVAQHAESNGLIDQDNSELAQRVVQEAQEVGVGAVPTIFVGDQAFVETVEPEAFKQAIMKNI